MRWTSSIGDRSFASAMFVATTCTITLFTNRPSYNSSEAKFDVRPQRLQILCISHSFTLSAWVLPSNPSLRRPRGSFCAAGISWIYPVICCEFRGRKPRSHDHAEKPGLYLADPIGVSLPRTSPEQMRLATLRS